MGQATAPSVGLELVEGAVRRQHGGGVAGGQVRLDALKLSARKEQLGQPSYQWEPNMKCWTISWEWSPNRSAIERGPSVASNSQARSTRTHGR